MTTEKAEMLERLDSTRDALQRILDTGLEPRNLSDPDKLRLQAALNDKRDYDRDVFDQTEVQDDLRRIADNLEKYIDPMDELWFCKAHKRDIDKFDQVTPIACIRKGRPGPCEPVAALIVEK